MTRLIPALFVVMTGCWNEVDGGPEVAETRTLETFSRLRVESGITVHFEPGAPSVDIATQEEVLKNLETVVHKGTLLVRLKPGVKVSSFEWTEVHVTGEGVDELTARNGSTIDARFLDLSALEVEANEGSNVLLSGVVGHLEIDASGGSDVLAETQTDVVELDLSGGASAWVNASVAVSGSASGGSSVYVTGGADRTGLKLSGGATAN